MKFGIVGCGHIAKKHAEALQQMENSKLVAVCDKIPENMEPYTNMYGVKSYTDFDKMLEDPELQVVNICTPSGTHASLAVKAAQAKKHVIIEKPIALTLVDAKLIIDTCKANDVKLSVVHPNRFRPVVMELTQLFKDGLFGMLSHSNATVRWNRNQTYYDQAPWRGTKSMDGGVLMNQAIHNLDLMLWMMGPISEIQAFTATRIRNIESEDVATAVIRFNNGSLGVVEATTNIYPKNLEESLSIFGEKGTVVIGGPNANWYKHIAFDGLSDGTIKSMIDRINNDPFGKSGHQAILEDLVEAINDNREPSITGEDGMNVVKFVLGIIQAGEQKKAVRWEDIE